MIGNSLQRDRLPDPALDGLRQALAQLAAMAVIPKAAAALQAAAGTARDALRQAVLAEVVAFSESHNPQVLAQLGSHAAAQFNEVLRLFGGGAIGDFEFIRDHARQRAEQRFPLEATLHAYRCGQREFSRWLRDAAVATRPKNRDRIVSATADFAIEYTNTISSIATSEYVAHTRTLAQAEGDLRTELLNILFSGYDESDGRVARLLRRAGYLEQRQSYCVVVAQSTNAAEMEHHQRAQRIVDAIGAQLQGSRIRMLSGIRENLVTAVLSAARRQSGWTPASAQLAERVQPLLSLLGPSVLVGISADHPSTAFLPKALQEATMALEFASVENRVARFTELPVRTLLIRRGADYVRTAQPSWTASLIDADTKAEGALIQTLRAVADADMNVQKAARLLARHPNTVYTRLERIRGLTGLDGQRYHDLTELLLAADCAQR